MKRHGRHGAQQVELHGSRSGGVVPNTTSGKTPSGTTFLLAAGKNAHGPRSGTPGVSAR